MSTAKEFDLVVLDRHFPMTEPPETLLCKGAPNGDPTTRGHPMAASSREGWPQGQAAAPRGGLGGEDLMDLTFVVFEAEGRGCHVEAPHASAPRSRFT